MRVDAITLHAVDVRGLGRWAMGKGRRVAAVVLAVLTLAWAGWAISRSLRLHEQGVPIDWVGLAFIWSGLALVAIGLLAWATRNNARTGWLIAVCGFLFLVGSLGVTRVPVLWTLGAGLSSAFMPVLAFLALTFPARRVAGSVARLALVLVAVSAITWGPPNLLFSVPQDYGCTGCPDSTNLVLLPGHEELGWTLAVWYLRLTLVAWGLLLAVLAWRLVVATAPARRVLAPVYIAIAVYALSQLEVSSVILLRDWALLQASQFAQATALSLLPLGFAFGLVLARGRRWRVGNLAVELEQAHEPQRLEAAIGRALGDPSAELGTWSQTDGCYLAHGHALVLPEPGGTRAATLIEHEGEPIAAIVHDAALVHDERLIQGVAAITRLALLNEQLAEEVQLRLDEVVASRARIVAAADAERERVERNLHDGAQQRLVTLSLQLRLLQERVDYDHEVAGIVGEALDELGVALAELRELAQGLHPSVLTDHGLASALEYLAEHAPLPVAVNAPPDRYPAAVEATAYYVAAEALTNVAKYAHANRANVVVATRNGHLTIEVNDDGVGGADASRGSGLRGLADRAAALGGRLEVESPPIGGTRVFASLPCG